MLLLYSITESEDWGWGWVGVRVEWIGRWVGGGGAGGWVREWGGVVEGGWVWGWIRIGYDGGWGVSRWRMSRRHRRRRGVEHGTATCYISPYHKLIEKEEKHEEFILSRAFLFMFKYIFVRLFRIAKLLFWMKTFFCYVTGLSTNLLKRRCEFCFSFYDGYHSNVMQFRRSQFSHLYDSMLTA